MQARRFFWNCLVGAALVAPLVLTACADPDPLYVDQAWVRLSPNSDTPSGGYFTVHGGPEAVQLRGVTSQATQRIEMHETGMKDGMMTMAPVDAVAIPAGEKIAFAPGGKHLMIWGVNPAVVQSGKLPLTLLFSNGDRILVDAAIRKAGQENAGNAMEGHGTH